MKAILNNWWLVLLAVLFGGIGWLSKDINLNGVSGATEPMALGGLTIGGVCAMLWLMFSRWQAGGGKFDGKMTEKEFDDLTGTLLERLAPHLIPFVDKVDKPLVAVINSVVSPTATKLIDDLTSWFVDKTPDPNEPVLNFKLLELLHDSLKDVPEALSIIATLKAIVAQRTVPAAPAAVPVV